MSRLTALPHRRLARAVATLAVLVGLLAMHALAAPPAMSLSMPVMSASAHADHSMVDAPPAVADAADAAFLDTDPGCGSSHDHCLAVLRAATYLPLPVDAAPTTPSFAADVSAWVGDYSESRAPPHIVDLSELCISRT